MSHFKTFYKCEGKSYGIIQFSIVPDKQLKAQLKDNYGVNLLAYLPESCYFASFSSYNDIGRLKDYPKNFPYWVFISKG